MGRAAQLTIERQASDSTRLSILSQSLLNHLHKIQQVSINGNRKHCVPGIISVSFAAVESEALMLALKDIAVSNGSACTSASVEPSHVLAALGLDEDIAHSTLRLSIGRFTTPEEIQRSAQQIAVAVYELRQLSSSTKSE